MKLNNKLNRLQKEINQIHKQKKILAKKQIKELEKRMGVYNCSFRY